jgi:exonuclease SbcC
MNSIGKKYPRIYSISTVGIRNHNNADFLIHPLRTDFTGQSGTGKSLIGADLPQLILTAGRFYKSATKPKGDVSRDYNSIPLSNKDFAYAFMNIEWKQDKFIVIGVMIRKSPKQLHPFIIQSNMGIHSENNPAFKPLTKIIRYKDFIQNGEILTLDNFIKHYDDQDIYLKSFFHNIQSYHKLLSINKILHLDLSTDENLQRQYAHTLQSLARGEDIDTSGNKFKRFLFHYDDEIAEKFKNQAKSIEDDHRKYEEDWKAKNTLSRKRDYLVNLASLKKERTSTFELRIEKETAFYYQQKQLKEAELKKTSDKFFEVELEIIAINERKVLIEVDQSMVDKMTKETELKKQQEILRQAKRELEFIEKDLTNIESALPAIEKTRDELKSKNGKNIQAESWLKVYNSIEGITTKFFLQQEITVQRQRVKALISFLQTNNLTQIFEQSEYSKTIKPAIEYYRKQREDLDLEKSNTEKLRDIIEKQNPESFAGWAINKEMKLGELQESVLFHFATAPTKASQTENYIPDPKKFIEALKQPIAENKSGYVIDLSGLYYHIPKRKNFIFTDPKKLKAEVEKIGNNFKLVISNLESEITKIDTLEKLFTVFDYSQEYLSAYKNRDEINSFVLDASLNLTEEQFSEIVHIYMENLSAKPENKLENRFLESQKQYEQKLGQRTTSEQNKNTQVGLQILAKNQIEALDVDIESKEKRIGFLQDTELVGIEAKIISWKADAKNNIRAKQETLLNQFRQKYRSQKDSNVLTTNLIELNRESGKLEAEIKGINLILPALSSNYTTKKTEFERYFGNAFSTDTLFGEISEEIIEICRSGEIKARDAFENRYQDVLEIFKEDLQDNPKLRYHQYDLNTLILELIPHEIITNKENPEDSLQMDIDDKLAKLHHQIKELNKEEAKKIHNTVRDLKKIVEQQTTFLDLVKALLKDFRLATYHKVLLNWNYSSDYNIKWIDALNKDIENLNFTDNLFGEKSKVSAHELLEETFKKYCPSKFDAKANEILNPFNYYEASAIIVDPNNNPNPGSSGQNYGMLALLCIAKLSIVEGKTKNAFNTVDSGLRILPIDEVAGLGENFDMLYDIAQRLDYQIFTMTITANDLAFENGKQIYYEFIKNSDEKRFEYNEGVQACFSKENLIADIETHFSDSVFTLELASE